MADPIDKLSPREFIIIKGARVHNLQNVSVAIPRNRLVVVTGVSGSGKSSLCIDTLYAEGQRRYVESLSSYARQFLNRMNKPEVDYIKGICPAIAIEQKVSTRTSRSTVGTLTEIYDYLRLLFARVGKTISPVSGNFVKKDDVSAVVDHIFRQKDGSRVQVFCPLNIPENRTLSQELSLLMQKGFNRLWVDGDLQRIEEADAKKLGKAKEVYLLIDRFAVKHGDADSEGRAADSVQTAFVESEGDCIIDVLDGKRTAFSNRFELDGMRFEEPSPAFFNFNNPYGACKKCEGFGSVIGIDENLVIPDKSLSVYDQAIAAWRGVKMSSWNDQLVHSAHHFDFPVHKPISELTKKQYKLLWTGNDHFSGLNEFFTHLESKSYKIQFRVMLSRYRGRTKCSDCEGTRLRKDTQYVKINDQSIVDVVLTPIKHLGEFFDNLKFNKYEEKIAKRILTEVQNRLGFMMDVGLGYLNLNRLSSTLSGGETQRINLTRTLGSNLTSSMYILDEPSIGLHPRDTGRLIKVMRKLRDLGNTVIVVEHEEEIIRAADYIIDMGPMAGRLGGEITFEGLPEEMVKSKTSLTGDYLTGRKEIPLPEFERKPKRFIEIKKASQHNLKSIDVKFPLNAFTVVSGVSGSGKTTLIKNILYPALKREVEGVGNAPGQHKSIIGDMKSIKQIELVSQNPLGRSSRSNPVTFVKAYDLIRELYSKHKLSQVRGYRPKHFSFNVEGGRCETCKGEGETTVEMQFLADIHLPCDDCAGKRFKMEILDVKYQEKHISDVLDLTVDESLEFFAEYKEIIRRLKPLADVGLGYIKLGQSSSTLSGGEAQRVKLASFLGKGEGKRENVFFIFDEPTTGLHFNDINKLLTALNALVEKGHTVLVIEHNTDVIKCADWLIDLGPEGGDEGGDLLYQGKPKGILKVKKSHTAGYLKGKL